MIEPEWTSDDASSLRTFLSTETGRRFKAILDYNKPPTPIEGNPTRRLTTTAIAQGWEMCVDSFYDLFKSHEKIDDTESNPLYPDLDDPKAWEEVDKLAEQTQNGE